MKLLLCAMKSCNTDYHIVLEDDPAAHRSHMPLKSPLAVRVATIFFFFWKKHMLTTAILETGVRRLFYVVIILVCWYSPPFSLHGRCIMTLHCEQSKGILGECMLNIMYAYKFIFLFIYGVFNDAVSSAYCIASNVRWIVNRIMNNEFERI
jgi:hypothetical protein